MSASTTLLSVSPVELEERFHRLAKEWKEQARYLSNTARMAMLQPYQRIIGMGMPVVPLILEDLKREPHHWFLGAGSHHRTKPGAARMARQDPGAGKRLGTLGATTGLD